MDKYKEAIVYARVSGWSQCTGSGLQRQLETCLKYAKKNRYSVVACFSEIRGSKEEYTARRQAERMAKNRDCLLLCESEDRWTRRWQDRESEAHYRFIPHFFMEEYNTNTLYPKGSKMKKRKKVVKEYKEAVIYARVSSWSQVTGHGLQRQLDTCMEYAKKHDYHVVGAFSEIRRSDEEYVARKQAERMASNRGCKLICETMDRWTRKGIADAASAYPVIFTGVEGDGDNALTTAFLNIMANALEDK